MSDETIRIKLEQPKENKTKGFYLLLTNGNTYSDKQDEFLIDKKFLTLLNEKGVKYTELPIN